MLFNTLDACAHKHRRFGFSNKEALDSGETGTACRGEEHDVTLIWSVASGKRIVAEYLNILGQ